MRIATALTLALTLPLAFGCGGPASDPKAAASELPDAGSPPTPDAGEAPDAGSPAPTTCTTPPAGSVVNVTVAELHALGEAGETIAVVDVREPSETAAGVIEGALLYPWNGGQLEARHADLPTDRPIYVYCRSGSRSAAATRFLADQGHACIHNVQGGMNAWAGAGYPTVSP